MTSATLLSRVERARRTPRVDVLRLLLTLLAVLPYVLGWTAAAIVTALGWLWAAVVAGWRDVRTDRDEPA